MFATRKRLYAHPVDPLLLTAIVVTVRGQLYTPDLFISGKRASGSHLIEG
jgi:hypothetical protein